MSKTEESEFDRGYNFGKLDAYNEVFRTADATNLDINDQTLIFKIPLEKLQHLKQETERTA